MTTTTKDLEEHLYHRSKYNFWQIISNKFFNTNPDIISIDIIKKDFTSDNIKIERKITVDPHLPWLLQKILSIKHVSYYDNIDIDLKTPRLTAVSNLPVEFNKYAEMVETQTITSIDNSINDDKTLSDLSVKLKLKGIINFSILESLYRDRRGNVVNKDMTTLNNILTREQFEQEIKKQYK
jgi:hypothetical protein